MTARILCIEDEPCIRTVIVEELRDAGYQVVEATNGREGLEAILKDSPDLVISDWLMGDMSGCELLVALRNDYSAFAKLPFVLMSAHTDEQHMQEGLALGADAYLTKPIDHEVLLETVAAVLVPRRQAAVSSICEVLQVICRPFDIARPSTRCIAPLTLFLAASVMLRG